MIKHLTFSNDCMTNSAEKCIKSALKHGCDSTVHFMPHHIDPDFYCEHFDILKQARGAGYWLWKPYFILQMLEQSENYDYIVYTDAGMEFVADIDNLISEMVGDIMVFANGWRHGDWCKMDVLKGMGCLRYADKQQLQASCIIIKVSDYSKDFVKHWLRWCSTPFAIDDSPSILPNEPTFREHRHDQAILTNLVYREGIPLNRWCAQYNLKGQEQFNNKYGVVVNHHGLRNNGKRT